MLIYSSRSRTTQVDIRLAIDMVQSKQSMATSCSAIDEHINSQRLNDSELITKLKVTPAKPGLLPFSHRVVLGVDVLGAFRTSDLE
jgi:hypothetical protein